MSLIHEALQKAEAERRAGELPPLLSVTAPVASRSRSRASLWLLAPLVLVISAVVYNNRGLIRDTLVSGGQADQQPTQTALPDAQASAATTKRMAESTPSPGPAAPEPNGGVAAPAAVAAPLAAVAAKPVGKLPDAAAPATDELVKNQSNPENPQPTVPEPIMPEPTVPEPTVPEAAAPSPDAPVTTVDAMPRVPEPVVANTQSASAPAAAPSSAPEVAATPAVPYVFELPLGTRQALPALKVTMHVYNADPARRFAIIDGKRINEGGILGNDLNVIEIQRDAILIDLRGTRFLLPRIGR